MTAEPEIAVEILATVKHFSGQQRAIARTKDDRYAIGSLQAARSAGRATGKELIFAPITPYVSFGDVLRTAENIIAGDPRATTWPPAHLVMALGVVVVANQLTDEPNSAGSSSSPDAGVPPADEAAAPAGRAHPTGAAADLSPQSPSREDALPDHLPYQHTLTGALETTLKPEAT
jgi:hypothetical protein